MTRDFTLVIPTYNRHALLAALLRFLRADGADFPVLVLDSSRDEIKTANARLLADTALQAEHVLYDASTHPFDKFRDGVHRVKTAYSGLCADDDLVLVDAVQRCVEFLSANPAYAVAHGYYFTFMDKADAGLELHTMLYFSPTIADDDPLSRLRSLFASYQALTYGIYRTPTLQRIFDAIRPLTSIMARELLSSALAAVAGKVARLPCFYGGRSMNPSESYEHWHPLEWLITDPGGLFAEYGRYRDVLVEQVLGSRDNAFSRAEAVRIVDLIHTFYLVKHAPPASHDFILEQVLSRQAFKAFWNDARIQAPLWQAHYRAETEPSPVPSAPDESLIARVVRRLRGAEKACAEPPAPWPREIARAARTYRLFKSFGDAQPRSLMFHREHDVEALLARLDHYRIAR